MKYSLIIFLTVLFSCSEQKNQIILNAEKIEGLTTESEININGFPVGEIKEIKIASNGTINIKCNLDSEVEIPSDSEFMIEKLDLFGKSGIGIKMGESSRIINNGDILQLTNAHSISINDSLSTNLRELLDNLIAGEKKDSILIELRRLNENLERIGMNK
jgi:ABC-type transporter Mla subunit MlaD